MKIKEILKNKEAKDAIAELKSKRFITQPETDVVTKQLDPMEHDVMCPAKRPNKKVKLDSDDDDFGEDTKDDDGFTYEPVARIGLALQKLIVKRAVAFLFGNPVELNAETDDSADSKELEVLRAVRRVMFDVKEKSLNRQIAREVFSCTEVAELWYPVEKKNKSYGFDSEFKLRCAVFSPLLGDTLYPYFDNTGDMVAFSREFSTTDSEKKEHKFFETYTDELHVMWEKDSEGYKVVEGYPKDNILGKIPIVFGNQSQVEWADVQVLIDRLEKLLSNFADTNDYHASPKIFVQGTVLGFGKKGESGAIIEGEQGATASYLSWENAPESVKLEIETLLRMIYTISQTPDISFETVKGLGSISGVALKLLFMDAHLKVADHQELFDEYLQRRVNVVKAFIGKFNTKLESHAEALQIVPEITPYMIDDEITEVNKWVLANGGKPVVSQKLSSRLAGFSTDPEADYEQMQEESDRANTFSIGEPTDA